MSDAREPRNRREPTFSPAPEEARPETANVRTSWDKGVAARNIDALATIACIYLALITIGFAAFRFLSVMPTGSPRNPDRTFFAAANAVTMTGFTTNAASAASFPLGGRILIASLAVGGAMTLLVGGGAFLRSVLGMRSVGLGKLIALSLLLLVWPLVFTFAIGLFDAFSAGSGLGWSVTREALNGQSPGLARWLMLVGSIPATVGPLLLLWLVSPRVGGLLSGRVLMAIAVVYLLATVLFSILGVGVSTASFEAINARGLGLVGNSPATLPAPMAWLMMAMMCFGVGPASTSGGLSLLPLVLAGIGAVHALRGQRVPPIVGVALAWIAAFVGLLVLLLVAFVATNQPMPGDRQLFLIVSAFCNVGISHDPIGVTGAGLVVLSATMLLGRALPLVMLCWMAIAAASDEPPAADASIA